MELLRSGWGPAACVPVVEPSGALTPLDGAHTSYYDRTNCLGDEAAGCALTDLVAVGSKPAGDGRWGQSDLAGNVFEWPLDWYAAYAAVCTDCADITPTSYRVIRGGGVARGRRDRERLRLAVSVVRHPSLDFGHLTP
jgi:formylglycine-generating enzyme required for sulfatase activity